MREAFARELARQVFATFGAGVIYAQIRGYCARREARLVGERIDQLGRTLGSYAGAAAGSPGLRTYAGVDSCEGRSRS